MHKTQLRHAVTQTVTVGFFQSRTCEHGMRTTMHQLIGQDTQPTRTVLVGQGNAGAHFCHVFWGMKLIPFDQSPAKGLRQRRCKTGLTATGHTHDDNRTIHFDILDSAIPFGKKGERSE